MATLFKDNHKTGGGSLQLLFLLNLLLFITKQTGSYDQDCLIRLGTVFLIAATTFFIKAHNFATFYYIFMTYVFAIFTHIKTR